MKFNNHIPVMISARNYFSEHLDHDTLVFLPWYVIVKDTPISIIKSNYDIHDEIGWCYRRYRIFQMFGNDSLIILIIIL